MKIKPLGNRLEEAWHMGSLTYYPYMPESLESFQSKQKAYPQGCLGLFNNDVMIGYMLSHPWNNSVIKLNAIIKPVINPTCYYLHDISILPEYQGNKFGQKMVGKAIELGNELGLKKFSLVSVNKSKKFWEKMGFISNKIIKYGPALDKKGNVLYVDGYYMTLTQK